MVLLLLLACPGPAPVPSAAPPRAPALRFHAITPPLAPSPEPVFAGVVEVDGQPHPLRLQRLVAEGQVLDGQTWGALHDLDGDVIMDGEAPALCNGSDFAGLMVVAGQPQLVVHVECQPGAVWVAGLDASPEGLLTPTWFRPVDHRAVRGTSLPCAGHLTPWGTHLGSEEYETDARALRPDGTVEGNRFGWNDLHRASPGGPPYVYDYGWVPELRFTGAPGEAEVVKRLAMGRLSHEQALVMPDRRSVYLTDDTTNGVLTLFVADRPDDLSAGHLYAARFEARGPDAYALTWVPLGHADEAALARSLSEDRPGFTDLFDAADPEAGACPEGFGAAHAARGLECLRVRAGMEVLASRLETRRAAALAGATAELRKAEGITLDPVSGRVFMALSRLDAGATAGHPDWDLGGPDHLGFTENRCGGILELVQGPPARDAAGAPIDSPHVAAEARLVLAGRPEGEGCALEGIANPDNIAALPGGELLMIAEDTHLHPVDLLWAFHLDTGALVPVLAAPGEAEITGLQWTPNLQGFGYLTLTFQQERGGGVASASGVLGPFPDLRPR